MFYKNLQHLKIIYFIFCLWSQDSLLELETKIMSRSNTNEDNNKIMNIVAVKESKNT